VVLAPYTTFGIGGPARYFCEVESVNDLKNALKFSKENHLCFFILGGGSNILISDKGFGGLVIKMGIKGLEFTDKNDYSILSAGAGENWDKVVATAVEMSLGGIENLSWIPGTAGAAVYQNIGAYGVELKDVLESAEVLDSESGEIKTFSNNNCKFEYRDSVFKYKESSNLVILRANLRLSTNNKPKLIYPDLVRIFEGKKPSVSAVRQAVIETRKRKLPYPTEIPGWAKASPQEPSPRNEIGNAGSFFKNPIVTAKHFEKIALNHPDLKGFKLADGSVKLFVAQMIEKDGWKGKRFGKVGVSEKHSLVLVNYGKGTAEDMVNLAEKIKLSVKDKFGVELEPEVEMIGRA